MREGRGYHVGRRDLLRASSALLLSGCAPMRRCAEVSGGPRPEPLWGVQSGDVTESSAVVWARSDRPARMTVGWSHDAAFRGETVVEGPFVGPDTDLVGKVRLDGLGAGRVHYRVRFDRSPWMVGSLRTAPVRADDVVFAWSGDVNGQGWGIDPAHGGMPAYTALLDAAPDLFLHCGDAIYADNPIPPSLPFDGGTWTNELFEPAKAHVAETLDDFRAAHRYGRRSREVQAASAAIPAFHVWDDHDVRNNWFPTEVLEDPKYHERRLDVLAPAARRAFHEYTPTLRTAADPMYRVVRWGPLVDFFFLDGRSYRTPNEPVLGSDAPFPPPESAFFGKLQTAWLLEELARSRAVWKVVVADMPLGIVCSDLGRLGKLANDAVANGIKGGPVEREVEIASLLSGMKARGVKNAVWVTAELHYCAAHRYDPARAVFKDFDPFWELVAGPLHSTMFPQKPADETFGPEVTWANVDWERMGGPGDRSTQTFGLVRIDAKTRAFEARWVDAAGRVLHRQVIDPV